VPGDDATDLHSRRTVMPSHPRATAQWFPPCTEPSRIPFLVLLLLAVAWPEAALAQRDLTPMDVVMLQSVTGAYPSPDGSRIAFTRSIPRGPEDGPGRGYAELYLTVAGAQGAEEALVVGKRSIGGVAWHPSGGSISFLERREDDPGRQLYSLPIGGGESQRVFRTEYSVGSYAWRPDGEALVFTATLPPPEARARAREAGFRQTVYDEDWDPVGLFLWDGESGQVTRLEIPGRTLQLLQHAPC